MPKPISTDDQATFNKGLAAVQDLAERLTFRGFTCGIRNSLNLTKLTLRVGRADPGNGEHVVLTGLARTYDLAQLKVIDVDAEEKSIAEEDWGVDIPPALTTAKLNMLADVDARLASMKKFFVSKGDHRQHADILTWERYVDTVRPLMVETAHLARALLAGKKPSP